MELYQAINTQFVYDFHALPLVFEIFDIQATRAEAIELLEKLNLIHDLTTKHEKPDGHSALSRSRPKGEIKWPKIKST